MRCGPPSRRKSAGIRFLKWRKDEYAEVRLPLMVLTMAQSEVKWTESRELIKNESRRCIRMIEPYVRRQQKKQHVEVAAKDVGTRNQSRAASEACRMVYVAVLHDEY